MRGKGFVAEVARILGRYDHVETLVGTLARPATEAGRA